MLSRAKGIVPPLKKSEPNQDYTFGGRRNRVGRSDPPLVLDPVENVRGDREPEKEQRPHPTLQQIVIAENLAPGITQGITPETGLEYDCHNQPHKTYPNCLT